MSNAATQHLIIAITGASGALYGVRILQLLHSHTHLVKHLILSPSGLTTLQHETTYTKHDLDQLANHVHNPKAIGSCLASGSFPCAGMIIAPCSMRTLSAVANGLSDNLITRAADVTLKERRKLVLMVRETPFNLAHIRNMELVTQMGGIIFPPVPSFYHNPQSIHDLVTNTAKHAIALAGFDVELNREIWKGL